jgi:predicted small secreted protein
MVVRKWLHLFFACAVLVLSTLTVAGCNTTRGVGQDMQGAGEAIEDTAEDAQQ